MTFSLRQLFVSLGLVAVSTIAFASTAGAVQRPDFQGLGNCAPNVERIDDGHVQIAVQPKECATQIWTIGVYDLRSNDGRFYTDQIGQVDNYNDSLGVEVDFDLTGFCGSQIDFFVNDELYAADLDEDADGCDIDLSTAISAVRADDLVAVSAVGQLDVLPATGRDAATLGFEAGSAIVLLVVGGALVRSTRNSAR